MATEAAREKGDWLIDAGALVADKGKGHLVTKNSYKNFQINAEFWADEEANSGIFIRCKDPTAIGARTCYEVNIFDKRPDPSYGTGSIVYLAEGEPDAQGGRQVEHFRDHR